MEENTDKKIRISNKEFVRIAFEKDKTEQGPALYGKWTSVWRTKDGDQFFRTFCMEAIEEIIALESEFGEIVTFPKLISVLENIQRSKKYKILLPELEEKVPFRVLGRSFLENKRIKNIPLYAETVLARKFYRDLMARRKGHCMEFKLAYNENVRKIILAYRLFTVIEEGELETTIDKIDVVNAEDICLDSMEYPDFPQEDLFSFDEIYRLNGTVVVFEKAANTKEKEPVKVRKRKKKDRDNKESNTAKNRNEEYEKSIYQKIHEQQQVLREQRLEERRREKEQQRKQISMASSSKNKIIAPNEMPMAFAFNESLRKLPENWVPLNAKSLCKIVPAKIKPDKKPKKPTLKVIMPNANSPLIGATDTLVINTFDIKTDLQAVTPVSDSVSKQPKKRRKLIELENIFSKIIENMEMTLTQRIQDRFTFHTCNLL
ncbi:unnamed protein product [Oikopleura dioica]|uniref:Uncharacterized protein n=1 Tax=Oikopleura dioica TaxID=34765 RepID=E4X7U8_OIKDI|nr:unnamed protein product [Oikopleura dioica]